MSVRERNVLQLIRGVRLPGCDDDEWSAFERLRRVADGEGLSFMPPEGLIMSADEVRLLGILAMLQRPQAGYDFDASLDMRAALRACVAVLARLQLHLDWRNLARIREAGPDLGPLTPRPIWQQRRRPPFAPPDPSTLQARVLRFISDRRVSWLVLRDYGLTKQFVRLMMQRNLIICDGSGNYRASPEATAWLTASSTTIGH